MIVVCKARATLRSVVPLPSVQLNPKPSTHSVALNDIKNAAASLLAAASSGVATSEKRGAMAQTKAKRADAIRGPLSSLPLLARRPLRASAMSGKTAVDPLWAFALNAVIPDLAEQDLEAFFSIVMKDQRIRDRMRRELLLEPRHKVNDLAETDQVELFQISRDARVEDGREHMGKAYHFKLVHLGAVPFRIREALRQLFRERFRGTYRTKCGKISVDGRYELRVDVDEDTEMSDAFEELEDGYMRALDKMVFDECIQSESDCEDLDITDKFGVQPDTALYDAYDLTLFDQEEQIREAFLEDCLAFFADTGGFQLPETVVPLSVPSNQVWVRKPRARIVLSSSRYV